MQMSSQTFISHEEKSASDFQPANDHLTLLLGGITTGDFELKPMLVITLKQQMQ